MTDSNAPPTLPPLNVNLDIPLLEANTVSRSGDGSTAQPSPSQQPFLPPAETMPEPEIALTFLVMNGNSRRSMTFPAVSTISRVKELVWTTWPSDWPEQRPPAPNYLRLFFYGRPLQDDEVLEDKFRSPITSTTPSSPTSHPPIPTIVHLAIRTNPPPTEAEEVKKKKRRGSTMQHDSQDDGSRPGCCGCIIC